MAHMHLLDALGLGIQLPMLQHTTFIQIAQGPSIEKYFISLWPLPSKPIVSLHHTTLKS